MYTIQGQREYCHIQIKFWEMEGFDRIVLKWHLGNIKLTKG